MPDDNYKVFHYLTEFQSRVIQHSEKNLMNIQNLSVVFGPNVLRSRDTIENAQNLVKDAPVVSKVMEVIVLHKDEIFTKHATTTKSIPIRANPAAYKASKKDRKNASSPSLPSVVPLKNLKATKRKSIEGGVVIVEKRKSVELKVAVPFKKTSPRDLNLPRAPILNDQNSTEPDAKFSQVRSPRGPRGAPPGFRGGRGKPRPQTSRPAPAFPSGKRPDENKFMDRAQSEFVVSGAPNRGKREGAPLLSRTRSSKMEKNFTYLDISQIKPEDVTIQQLFELLKAEHEARLRLEKRVAELEEQQKNQ